MFKIPHAELVGLIKEKAGLSEKEIEEKIENKMKQLSGLISKEGAAHIIANELGIKAYDKFQGKLQIKNILAGMRNVEATGKVTRVFDVREFIKEDRTGKVGSFIMGDPTGTIRVVAWGDQADNIKKLDADSIVKVVGGYVKDNKGSLEVHMNEKSSLEINPPGEKIEGVKKLETERKKISDLGANDNNAEIMGTIVRVFEPRFFEVCPECRKRARPRDGAYFCEQHGKVEPNYSFVLNMFLDDGSDNIRAVFFGDQALKVINKPMQEFMEYKDNPEKFEDMKTEMLGNIIKLMGRVNKNEMFDRLEFITKSVDVNPDPDEEIEKLNQEVGKIKNNQEENH